MWQVTLEVAHGDGKESGFCSWFAHDLEQSQQLICLECSQRPASC